VRVVDIESRLNIDCYKCEVRCNWRVHGEKT
jgi:hypothetical protein